MDQPGRVYPDLWEQDRHAWTVRVMGDLTAEGLTRKKIAEACGASERTVQRWKSGSRAPVVVAFRVGLEGIWMLHCKGKKRK